MMGKPRKTAKKRSLDLFPEGPRDLPARLHAMDQVTFQEGWACLRCGEPRGKERRAVLTAFDFEGREGAGLSICVGCWGVLKACLEKQTELVPIVVRGSGWKPAGAPPEEEELHPWDK